MVAKAEDHRLQNGAIEVHPRVREGQAVEYAPGRRVKKRRFLAQKVGQDDHAVAGGRKVLGLRVQFLSADPSCSPKISAQTTLKASRSRHAAVWQALSRKDMVIKKQFGGGLDAVRAKQDVARPAEFY